MAIPINERDIMRRPSIVIRRETPAPTEPTDEEEMELVEETPEEESELEEEHSDDMSDLFDVSEEDILGGEDDDDLSDLFDVTKEDVMGSPPAKRYRNTRRGSRSVRRSPPSSLGGMQY